MRLLSLATLLVAAGICVFADERAPYYPQVFYGPRVHQSPFKADPAASPSGPNISKPPSVVWWEGNVLEKKAIHPETPNTLDWDGEVTVAIHYNNASQDKVRIFARPYWHDQPVIRCGYHPSPEYGPQSRGEIEGWFTCCGPTAVDEVRVTMVDSITHAIVATTKIPVQFEWQPIPPNPTPRPAPAN